MVKLLIGHVDLVRAIPAGDKLFMLGLENDILSWFGALNGRKKVRT